MIAATMSFEKIMQNVIGGVLLAYIVFLSYHLIECIRRKDFKIFDKIFWTVVLLIPVVGLILYRGVGNEFVKKGGPTETKSNEPPKRKSRKPVKIELPPRE